MTARRCLSKIFLGAILLLTAVACQQPADPAPISPPATAVTEAIPTTPPTPTAVPIPAYLNPELPTAERVEDLLGRMSLEEKIGQMTLVEKNSIQPTAVTTYHIGGILSGGGGYPHDGNTPEKWAAMVDSYQEAALATPLGIPIIYGVDAVHGHNNLKGATIFPHNIGLGATRNPELLRQIGHITAIETRATGIPWNYAPVIAVPQDIRWGRTYEAYSENTELVSELGVAYMQGLQGEDLAAVMAVLATPKHYIGDGGTAWGTSRTENYMLDQGDMQVDEATLRELFLPPYQAAIDAGAQSIMVSFSSWNGVKMHAQKYLLMDVLKGELDFDGFLVSDWQAIDQISPNYYEAVVTSVNAGVDMNMAPYDYLRFINTMLTAVENGDITETRINDAVRRILTAKFDLGLFENPYADTTNIGLIGSAEHRALAQEAVSQSLVLLQNNNETLPLPKDARIFVAGSFADDIGVQSGGWTIEWQGKPGNITEGTTILEAIEATAVGEVQFNRFGRFENFDPPADVGIVVLGELPYAEGRGDAADLNLSASDMELIRRMGEQANKVVVILLSGRPLIITDALPLADAWVAAWLPGSEGQGVADNLFGNHPFTGTLPYTWPASMAQLPLKAGGEPLFPFGYGLTTDN
ncbi:MAG: beta-glucosidase [Chloroflexi bacterium]|nr:glycoside hydrolase family 3 C-terminal domain-containing protein [Ardenticatenaceae bacterium]MBL1128780.1 beta-glucosidase [Chloroflexota bacterium]NOG34858.1 beta-glucosidase [Chloroflexota bacterium]GIK58846.1 MAG: beta-glucosidase [Chloroflexota bacterium]